MKTAIKFLSLLILAAIIFATGCKKDDPGVPDINVGFKFLPENPIAGELVTFTNSSNGGKTFAWDFGDGNLSTEKNPTHTYEAAGEYTVVLKVDGYEELKATKLVTVQDQVPTITASLTQIQIGVDVTFTASIYNPGSVAVNYTWQFPAGVFASEDLDENGVGTGESVTVKFITPNDPTGHTISLTANMNAKDYVKNQNFVVKNQLGKTLYYAVKGGNIWTKKIYTSGDAEEVDLGVFSGQHPFNMQYTLDRLFVFDAGEKVKYVAVPVDAEAADKVGSIFSMAYDGTDYKTHITFTRDAYDDAFSGWVAPEENDGAGNIYWHNRNAAMFTIPVSTVDLIFDPATVLPKATNAQIPYYNLQDNPTYAQFDWLWGVINGGLKKINGIYWMSKLFNGHGLGRFEDGEIGAAAGTYPAAGAILAGYSIRYFEIDQVNQKVYFSVITSNGGANPIGLYSCDIDGSNISLIDGSPAMFENGGNEEIFITGIVVDNESGYVYWAYRGPAGADLEADPLQRSGIKRYKLDGTGQVEYFIADVEAYGLTIDHTKR